MMGDIVSLKLKRKDKQRVSKDAAAAANRAKFGRTKDAKKLAEARQELGARHLDAHKLENENK